MAVLKQVYDNDGPPTAFEVSSSATTTIGRHEECNIIIDSPAVSRFHSHIICDNGRYFIEDLNSRNGTLRTSEETEETILNIAALHEKD